MNSIPIINELLRTQSITSKMFVAKNNQQKISEHFRNLIQKILKEYIYIFMLFTRIK